MNNDITMIDDALPFGEPHEVTILPDSFLPPPSQLVLREENEKVTLSLSSKSIHFFKAEAEKHKVPYQRMIRNLLDQYVDQHS